MVFFENPVLVDFKGFGGLSFPLPPLKQLKIKTMETRYLIVQKYEQAFGTIHFLGSRDTSAK